MNEIKEKALAKLLEEMKKDHGPAEDAIHNWICDQEDEKLFEGVLADKKSIKEALKYCANQAKSYKSGSCAMVDDSTVFGWVYKYFTGKTKKVEAIHATVAVGQQPEKPKSKKVKKQKNVIDGQLDLFGELA